MPTITKKQLEDYEQLYRDRNNGRLLTPDDCVSSVKSITMMQRKLDSISSWNCRGYVRRKNEARYSIVKNILVIQGGGRATGNTAQLVNSFVKGAEEAGHCVEIISLLKNEVKGCLGCNACRYGKPCIQKDAFNDIVPKIKNADCIVFASPLYFWTFSAKLKAFIERFYCIAEEDPNPPLGRYEKYPIKDCALLMTSADDYFWTFEQAVSYYKFAIVNYIGFADKGMVLAGGCGDTNGKPHIDKTEHLEKAYEFGKNIYNR